MPTQSRARTPASWANPSKEGKPDYQETVHKADVSDRIVLNTNEAVIRLGLLMTPVPSPYPHYKVPLPSGNVYQVVDLATGVDTPYTIPVGYTFSILSYWWAFKQPVTGYMYLDTFILSSLQDEAFEPHYERDVLEDYLATDPTGLAAHTLGYTCTNEGTRDMEGYFMFVGKLREVGTPPFPDLKEVRCVHCGHMHKVDRKLGKVECPKCAGETTYMPIIFGRELI